MTDYIVTSEELSFCRVYGRRLLLGQIIFLLSLLPTVLDSEEDLATTAGKALTSPFYLAFQLACVFVATYGSIVSSSLNRLRFKNGVLVVNKHVISSQELRKQFDFKKGTRLRKVVQRIKYWQKRLKFLGGALKGFAHLVLVWLLTLYVCFCFGAPLNFPPFSQETEFWEQTSTFAALIVVHALLPVVLSHGGDHKALTKVFLTQPKGEGEDNISLTTPIETQLFYRGFGAIAGAWAGAIPIPLDWDRPWQAWPITCSVGCLCGAVISNLVMLVVAKHQDLPTLVTHKQKSS